MLTPKDLISLHAADPVSMSQTQSARSPAGPAGDFRAPGWVADEV